VPDAPTAATAPLRSAGVSSGVAAQRVDAGAPTISPAGGPQVTSSLANSAPPPALSHGAPGGPAGDAASHGHNHARAFQTAPIMDLLTAGRASSTLATPFSSPTAPSVAGLADGTRRPASEPRPVPPLSPAPTAPLVASPGLGGTGTGTGSSGFFFSSSAGLLETLTPVVPRLTGRLRIMSEVGRPAPFIALLAEPG
jgi:hypothetical protein